MFSKKNTSQYSESKRPNAKVQAVIRRKCWVVVSGLCIRTNSSLFHTAGAATPTDSRTYELGLSLDTPIPARAAMLSTAHEQPTEGLGQVIRRTRAATGGPHGEGFGPHLLLAPRLGLTAIKRIPLWDSIEVDTAPISLRMYTAVSDGTGNGVIGTCQLADKMPRAIISRLHAGCTSHAMDPELLGLIQSFQSLVSVSAGGASTHLVRLSRSNSSL